MSQLIRSGLLFLAVSLSLTSAALSGTLGAQAPHYSTFAAGDPTLDLVAGAPTLGSTMVFEVRGCSQYRTTQYLHQVGMLWGASRRTWAGGSLPASISGVASSGLLQVSPDVGFTALAPYQQGSPWTVRIAIPNDPTLLGVEFFHQATCLKLAWIYPVYWLGAAGHGVIGR